MEAYEDDKALSDHCLKSSGNVICVIAITGDEDKQETIDTLNMLKVKKDDSWAFDLQYGWIRADQAKSIVNSLQLPEDYPALFIIHPNKQLFRNYVGSWSQKNLEQWLNQVGSGRVQAWAYKDELKINEKPAHVEEPIIEEEEEEEEQYKNKEPVRDEL